MLVECRRLLKWCTENASDSRCSLVRTTLASLLEPVEKQMTQDTVSTNVYTLLFECLSWLR